MSYFAPRLADHEVILIDGGTGTELERRDVPMVQGAWSSAASLTHPDIVREIHEAYIQTGAEVIITNTFATSRHLLADAGLEHEFERVNRTAVELALEARDNVPSAKPVMVAGSISTAQMKGMLPPFEVARANYMEQARIQAEAGVDMFILEMMRDITHTQIVLDAVKQTGLPIWVGYSCKIKDGEVWVFNQDVRLAEALEAIREEPVELVVIMHTQTYHIDACLDVLQANWHGPIGVYAHSGHFIQPHWQFIDTISPAEYADLCLSWVERGVQVIGGCCGIGPEHMEVLQECLPPRI